MPKKGRFEKGSPEAIEFMAQIREQARLKREAIANGDLEKEDKPKKEKKPKKVKEAEIFKAKEEEPIISEEEEDPEPVRKVVVSHPAPEPKKFDKKPRPVAPPSKPEPEPAGVIEDIEPGVPTKRAYKKKEPVVEEKPIIIKAPVKKVKKIIIQEEEEPEYEIEYRKAPVAKKVPEKKEVVNNLKDTPIDNPLLGSRVYRHK